jgi:hypothetical protein
MGLFCLATKGTIEDDVKSAIRNLELFLEDDCQKRSDYLLICFVKKQIDDAIKKLELQDE